MLHEPRVVITNVIADDVPRELKRLDAAIATLRADLDRLVEHRDVADGGEHRDVLEAYRMFAYDQGWLHKIREAVTTGLTAEAGVERVQSDTRARMLRASDPYLRERLHDLDDLANRLMRVLIGQGSRAVARAIAGKRHPGRALHGPGGAARLRPQKAARPGAGGRRADIARLDRRARARHPDRRRDRQRHRPRRAGRRHHRRRLDRRGAYAPAARHRSRLWRAGEAARAAAGAIPRAARPALP